MQRPETAKSDADRRKRQAGRLVRILQVHRRLCGLDVVTEDDAAKIGRDLGVGVRTIYRDVATLRLLYETLGSSLLDP